MPSALILRRSIKAAAMPLAAFSPPRTDDLTILLYHRVGSSGREIDVPVDAFARQMSWLVANTAVASLDDALESADRRVVVSIDDGYRDFYDHVLPVLVALRVPAILYLATSLVGGGRDALTWTQLREAADSGLVTVGAHTHTHADLARADHAEAEREMRTSKELIEDKLVLPCDHFSYPWSVASAPARQVASRLFKSAALSWGTNRRARLDLHDLGRLPVLQGDGDFFFGAKVRGLLNCEALAYRALRRGPWRSR